MPNVWRHNKSEDTHIDVRGVIRFLHVKDKSPVEIDREFVAVYREQQSCAKKEKKNCDSPDSPNNVKGYMNILCLHSLGRYLIIARASNSNKMFLTPSLVLDKETLIWITRPT